MFASKEYYDRANLRKKAFIDAHYSATLQLVFTALLVGVTWLGVVLAERNPSGAAVRVALAILRAARSAGAALGAVCLSARRARVRRPAAMERRALSPRMSEGDPDGSPRGVPLRKLQARIVSNM